VIDSLLSYSITEMTLAAIPGDHHVAFNECLAVLYRDGQGMAYHDDGEPGMLSLFRLRSLFVEVEVKNCF
jgi:hypothetical protein